MLLISLMNPISILEKYFPEPVAYSIVYEHSCRVTEKALSIARRVAEPVDIRFIEEAAMLHDIGIFMTAAPKIKCFGNDPYITHGIHGRVILEKEGLHRHAMLCERHIGVGLTANDIKTQSLPLPCRDMIPTCIEEEIICFADLFYSKKPGALSDEKNLDQIRNSLIRYGQGKIEILENWINRFA
jgi:uncharacterized protein